MMWNTAVHTASSKPTYNCRECKQGETHFLDLPSVRNYISVYSPTSVRHKLIKKREKKSWPNPRSHELGSIVVKILICIAWIWFSSVRCNRTLFFPKFNCVDIFTLNWDTIRRMTSRPIFRPSVAYLGKQTSRSKPFKQKNLQQHQDVTRHAHRWTMPQDMPKDKPW